MESGTSENIYQEIAKRTGGDIYLGVVGPVRTGKSTFVKRFMEAMVIPYIDNIYQRERARDELPQSGSGKTIMTSEPKFVPEEAAEISPDGTSKLSVRLIDSVGYMIPGAIGAEEEGRPRMVTTPWLPDEIPMAQAAELGTKKIMDEHCSIGIVMTTDGTIHDIPREEFIEAERRSIEDMKATGKPFVVILNSSDPNGETAQTIKEKMEKEFNVHCLCVNCLLMDEHQICEILNEILCEFPVSEIRFYMPSWLQSLPVTHEMKLGIYEAMRSCGDDFGSVRAARSKIEHIGEATGVEQVKIDSIHLGSGILEVRIFMDEALFYKILSEQTGTEIKNDVDLMAKLEELTRIKQAHDKISAALDQVQATGYGIVMPTPDEMKLEVPQIVRKGSNFGVKLKASAPSIHMMRADIETEISPIVGDEKQSEELIRYLLDEYENDAEKLWQSNIFGKSVYDLVNEGLSSKLKRMPDESRFKLRSTLSRIINEGSSGLLCIILA